VCIKSPPPDLNCGDIPFKNFQVTGSDPHGFDRDNDGIGCDTANEDTQIPTPLTPPITPVPPPVTPDLGLPYCDLVSDDYNGSCHDRKDGDDINGYPCRDGSKVDDWRDCPDAGKHPDEQEEAETETVPTPTPTPTPTPAPTPNALARGLLPTTPSPTLDNPCDAIPEPDIPECKDLPAEIPEPTPLQPTPLPTEEIEEIPNVPLEDTEEEEVEEEEPEEPEEEESEEPEEEESGGNDDASSGN
jgi:hypothetical protein